MKNHPLWLMCLFLLYSASCVYFLLNQGSEELMLLLGFIP
jgi:hypothetical protein